jgi:hypothetical protein
LLRPVFLAILGALAWLAWLAGPSQASDLLPTVPAMPAVPTIPIPTVSLALAPLPDPIGPMVPDISSVIPSPSRLVGIPNTLVNQLPSTTVTPIIGIIDTVPQVVGRTIDKVPPLPELPSAPALPPMTGILPPPVLGLPIGAVLGVPLPPNVQAGPAANTKSPGFIPDRLVLMPAAVLATTEMSPISGGPPPGKPFRPAFPHEAGAAPGPQGGSVRGAADLPDQRALAPPFSNGPLPDGRKYPAAEPAFDPGSSPD